MQIPKKAPIKRKAKVIGWFLAITFTLLHLLKFIHSVPDHDYFSVIHVINFLRYPEYFAEAKLSNILAEVHLSTAPIYYYGIAYPLSLILEPKWILFTIGISISLISFYFAGSPWNSYEDLFNALLILIVLLHHHVTPLEGNRRSFIAFFLLSIFWLGRSSNFLRWTVFIGLAAGIYPPVALILLSYVTFYEINSLLHNRILRSVLIRLSGYYSAFLLILSPYWFEAVFSSSNNEVVNWIIPLNFKTGSLLQVLRSFMVGERYSLFHYQPFFDLFVVLIVIVLLQKIVLGSRFSLKREYALLLYAAFFTWALAQILHPLLYQPFKYTRVSLLLVITLIFTDNLSLSVEAFLTWLDGRRELRIFGSGLGIICFCILIIHGIDLLRFDFLRHWIFVSNIIWKFVLGFPVALVCLYYLKRLPIKSYYVAYLPAFFVLGSLFLPHPIFPRYLPNIPGESMPYDKNLYSVIQSTPKGTLIAGPPNLMDAIPAFGRRGVFVTTEQKTLELNCRRTKQLAEIYYSDSRREIYNFLQKKGIDYLLVDRKRFGKKKLTVCGNRVRLNKEGYLNRKFPKAAWSDGGGYFLLHRDYFSKTSS